MLSDNAERCTFFGCDRFAVIHSMCPECYQLVCQAELNYKDSVKRQRSRRLVDLDKASYTALLKAGLLWVRYPKATGNYKEDVEDARTHNNPETQDNGEDQDELGSREGRGFCADWWG